VHDGDCLCQVTVSKFANKQIDKLPKSILKSLQAWMETIEVFGIQEMRRLPGYHDEPLQGDRKGQRSSRLNRAYRVIYQETDSNKMIHILVLEVNKHDY